MMQSANAPSAVAAAQPPLPPGWTEQKAPSGHAYYYHAETKTSTYKRPGAVPAAAAPPPPPPPPPPAQILPSYGPYPTIPNLSDPAVANAYMAQFNQQHAPQHGSGRGHGGRGGFEGRPRPQPVDKPVRKEAIPGCEPWILVYTKYSRRYVYNPAKNASYWRIPEKLMPGILELDKARIRGKASEGQKEDGVDEGNEAPKKEADEDAPIQPRANDEADDSSEYEEVEVTDDEDEAVDDEHRQKRQRTEEPPQDGPLVFTEDDIAAQLQAMGEEYGLEPGDYDDGNMEDWPEGAEGLDFSVDDAKFLFKDLLNDYNINPYSPWDKLIEEGKIIDDPRYTALTTTKARRECWDEWTREKIAELKEQRARQEKKDPKIAYFAFLQEKATPKLYWPEFKRKYKKEAPMKDLNLSDKDREKAYREHINRLKLPQSTLRNDLTTLLKAQPLHLLNNKSLSTGGLPSQVLTDLRYISLEPKVRDPLIEAYVQTLPPPPEDPAGAAEEDEERRKERDARERRRKALDERNRLVDEQRSRRERDVAASKARLRAGERELEAAMRVDKRGLQGQLASMQVQDDKKE